MKTRLTALCAMLSGSLVAHGQNFVFDAPSDDRWHYPFNFTPGARAIGSCFGAAAIPSFNDRDGYDVLAWDTSAQIQPGLGPEAYNLRLIRVTLTNVQDAEWPVDLTPDEWFTFDLNGDGVINGDGIPRGQSGDTDGESDDEDPGRPLELFGAGFGPSHTYENWFETIFFVGSSGDGDVPRDPFPFVYRDGADDILHVEDNVKGLFNEAFGVFEFTPLPWAVGVPVNYTPGDQAVAFDVTFDINLSLSTGKVSRYFQEQLDAGRVVVIVTSLREAVVMGGQEGFPTFFMKEGLGLDPNAKAATLEIVLVEPMTENPSEVDPVEIGPFPP